GISAAGSGIGWPRPGGSRGQSSIRCVCIRTSRGTITTGNDSNRVGAQHAAPLPVVTPLSLIRPILVVAQLIDGILSAARPPPLLARMVGDRNEDFTHVVGVIRLLECMTQSGRRIEEPARILAARDVAGVHFDADDVFPRRNHGLSI